MRRMKADTNTEERKHASDLLAQLGVRQAAKKLGISAESLARFHGGLTVRAGTVALIRAHMATGQSR